jgi:multidrug efflux pump subunit AcrA (membrane-fusion protein)
VTAGQTVVRLAQAGPREAVVWLPETIRPAIGSEAEASLYGRDRHADSATLRQLSDSADPQTRTYEARYVLDGEAASAPLGATVTIGWPIRQADRHRGGGAARRDPGRWPEDRRLGLDAPPRP